MVGSEGIAGWAAGLAVVGAAVGERIAQLGALEDLKAAACAAQARIAVAFAASQEQEQAEAGVPTARRGAGVAGQVALARRESPHRGGRLLGLAKALVHEMPGTLRALESGLVNEWRATLIVRETACVTREDRTAIDAELWAEPAGVVSLGDRALVARVRAMAYRVDPHAVVADAARSAGDPRSAGQVGGDEEPAVIPGYGPVPAGLARRFVGDRGALATLRRLYTHPGDGRLVAMEAHSRRFPAGLAELIDLRDQVCRTPWCDAPVRHHDHVVPDAAGGPSSLENGQGLCEACNYTKQAPRWRARPGPGGAVVTITPTGHRYLSPEPIPPRRPPDPHVPRQPLGLQILWGPPIQYVA